MDSNIDSKMDNSSVGDLTTYSNDYLNNSHTRSKLLSSFDQMSIKPNFVKPVNVNKIYSKPILNCYINGICVNMEFDSGSSLTVVSKGTI